jgi:hypothetical protein
VACLISLGRSGQAPLRFANELISEVVEIGDARREEAYSSSQSV